MKQLIFTFSDLIGYSQYRAIMKNDNGCRIYTKQIILSLAKDCYDFKDFRKKFPGPYQQAYQQGWKPAIKSFLNKKTAKMFKFKDILKLSENCKTLDEFYSTHPDETRYLKSLQLVKNFKIHFKSKHPSLSKNAKRYTDKEIYREAKKFGSKEAFATERKGLYEAALRRKIIDKVCSHMNEKIYYNEEYVRQVFKLIFKKRFIKTKPEFLINPKTNRRMELDGYCEELQVAFEYNGPRHNPGSYLYVEGVQEKDELKAKICRKRRIKLFVFKAKQKNDLDEEMKRKLKIKEIPEVSISIVKNKAIFKKCRKYKKKEFLSFSKKKQINIVKKYLNLGLTRREVCLLLDIKKAQLGQRINNKNARGNPLVKY